jgi:hypothetical protein
MGLLKVRKPISGEGIWAAMATIGTRDRCQPNTPLIECRSPGRRKRQDAGCMCIRACRESGDLLVSDVEAANAAVIHAPSANVASAAA